MTPRRKLRNLTCPSFLAHGIYHTVKISPWSQETSPTLLDPMKNLASPNRTLYDPIQQFQSEGICMPITSMILCEGGGTLYTWQSCP